jgi:hypothetical protein
MTTAGKLECRFFWEYLNDGYLIYDRQRGAGCFGENFVATAVDGPTAELMCGLMNSGDALAVLVRHSSEAHLHVRLAEVVVL